MSLIHNATFDSQTRVLSLLDKAGNVISSCEVPSKDVDDITKPLTLTATADNSSVKLMKHGTLSNTYEVNTGSGWTSYAFGTTISLNAGQSCKWRCKSHPTMQSEISYVQFVMTGTIEASGNCNSMLSRDFKNITSLSGYDCAFTSLFSGCTALTRSPELPATTLAISCYRDMFYGCTSLVQSPELPATTLEGSCYRSMFYGCSKLKEVRISATTTAISALSNWLKNVSATGDFYCNQNATIFPSGVSGIPVGWNSFVLGAEDTGTTTTLYHNGSPEIVKVGTSSYGYCYALQGWVGFKQLAQMHALGYTLGAQTPLTMYSCDSPVSVYSCDANVDDGFTETMYDVGNGTGYLTIAQQNANGYYLTATPYTGLTLTAATADYNSVRLVKKGKLSNTYEVNTGSGWQSYHFGTVINLNSGESCKWRCKSHPTTQSKSDYVYFDMRGKIEASGNCNSMLSSDFENITSLSEYCYYAMFSGCTALTRSPELPAKTLADYCYYEMFYNCTSLVKPPELPATILTDSCYCEMFEYCSKLNEARVSATTTAMNALFRWLTGVSDTGDFYCDPNATIFPPDNIAGIPKGWTRRNINLINALTLTATADNSSVKLAKNGTLDNTFEVDTGNGWTAYEFNTVIPLNAGQSCKWRCSAHPTTQSDTNYVQFVMIGKIEASGNVNSMLSRDFENLTSLSGYDYAFKGLFYGCTSLMRPPELPATTLANNCYHSMFKGCTSLVQSPELPAKTLADYCYVFMFYGCTSLVQPPELPATTLANYCYRYMFDGCTSLVQPPELPATTLARNCYEYMFAGCTSLVRAPELPATTLALAYNCYGFMFHNCTSLVQPPELPATTLANSSYTYMFTGCTSLTKAPSLPATSLASLCYEYMFAGCQSLKEVRIAATTNATGALEGWLQGVSATGDFYCDPAAKIFPTDSESGIPKGWTRKPLSDYPQT